MSLISTYQSRKSLFAEKLSTKGVEASATDGLTTLINKIDDISSIGNGIFLFGDKEIIQSSQSVYFNAFVVKEGKLVNDPIKIYAPDSSYVNPMTSNVSDFTKLGDSDGFTVTNEGASLSLNEPASFNQVYLNKVLDFTNTNHEIMFKCKPLLQGSDAINGQVYTINGSGYNTNFIISSTQVEFCMSTFSFPSSITWGDWLDVVLSYTPTEQKIYINGILVGTSTYDFSADYDANAFYFALFTYSSNNSFIVKNLSVFSYDSVVGSGSHGACLGEYVGTGSGLKNFYAQSGSIVSRTYEIMDAIFYDKATNETGAKNNYWYYYNVSQTPTPNGTTVQETSNGGTISPSKVASTTDWGDRKSFTPSFAVEFDVSDVENTNFLMYHDSTHHQIVLSDGHYKFLIDSTNGISYIKDNSSPVTVTSNPVSTNVQIHFNDKGEGYTMKFTFANFKVYPI